MMSCCAGGKVVNSDGHAKYMSVSPASFLDVAIVACKEKASALVIRVSS